MNAKDIAVNMAAYGMEWDSRDVNRGPKKDILVRKGAPIPVVKDLDLFRSKFPAAVLGYVNGQSLSVRAMAKIRNAKYRTASIDTLKEAIIASCVLGVRDSGTRSTIEVVREFVVMPSTNERVEVKDDTKVENAQRYIAELTDMGVSVEMATEKAKALFKLDDEDEQDEEEQVEDEEQELEQVQ